MRILRILLAIAAVSLIFPAGALAHGGVFNLSNSVMVYLNQQPLSPLVGEKVELVFSVMNVQYEPLRNTPVSLRLVETSNDSTQDRTILTESKTTDVNGNFAYEYSFDKEGYFDVELTVADPKTSQPSIVGFLIQPRALSSQAPEPQKISYGIAAAGAVLGSVITFAFVKAKKGQNNN
jgi:hypothetical protein